MCEMRKLAAILVVDVVGFSRLAGADETRTLSRLRGLRGDLIDPAIAARRGRVVKRTGDGALVEFRSVVDAVECAVEIQSGMLERNTGLQEYRRIYLRIGIHLGDIFEESDGDLMGDGINIASRLESVAEPGGIALSAAAYEQVCHKVDYSFTDAGKVDLKNIANPIHVYKFSYLTKYNVTCQDKEFSEIGKLNIQTTIAVLPFDNLSSEPEQAHFVDGLADDLITDLSRVGGLTVIARNSSFSYKGRRIDVRTVGRELGASYVIEGSVRRAGQRVRVNAQLAETRGGNQLWADRFDSDLVDVFDLQDMIVEKLVTAFSSILSVGLPATRRRAKTLRAFELCNFGRLLVTRSGDDNQLAREALQSAVDHEPDYSDAHAWLAFAHHYAWLYAAQPEVPHRGLSLDAASRAVALDPENPNAHWSSGLVLTFQSKLDESIVAFSRALALNPNLADAWATYADPLVYGGRSDEAVESVLKAMKLNPFPPERYRWFLGFAQYATGRYGDAAVTLSHPTLQRTEALRILAAAFAMQGKREEASRVAQAFLKINARFKVTDFMRGQPFANQPDRERFLRGYSLAGLPN